MIDTIRQDLRFAGRQLVRSPGFAALAVAMLALGIGATATIFSVINAVFLRPPAHVRDPERMISVFTSDYSGPPYGTSSYPDYQEFAGAAGLSGLAATTPRPFSASTGTESFRTFGELVSDGYFQLLGVPLAVGHGFASGGPGTEVVIGYGLWQRRFGSAPDVVGRTLRLSGHTFTVAGVAPDGFFGTMRGIRAEVWVPLSAVRVLSPEDDMLDNRGDRGLFLVGRLRDDVGVREAQTQLSVVATRLHRAYAQSWTDRMGRARVVTVLPERDARLFPGIRGPVTQFLGLLMAVACLVLLICCANLANLLLARGTTRRREVAVRLALGGSRGRLVRQLLTEGLLLAAVGAGGGVLLATWATGALAGFRPPLPIPVTLEFPLDGRILLFTVLVTVCTVALSALAPALRATRVDGATALRGDLGGSAAVRRIGLRDGLVVVQVAVSLVVLAAAGLFLASLRNATRIDPGFRAEGLALLRVELGIQGYDSTRGIAFYDEVQRRLAALPGRRGREHGGDRPSRARAKASRHRGRGLRAAGRRGDGVRGQHGRRGILRDDGHPAGARPRVRRDRPRGRRAGGRGERGVRPAILARRGGHRAAVQQRPGRRANHHRRRERRKIRVHHRGVAAALLRAFRPGLRGRHDRAGPKCR